MDMGNVESYQTIFVPEGEMTQYRGFGLGTCHRVNSPLTRVIQGGTQCVRGKECQGRTKRGMGGWVLILWKSKWKEDLIFFFQHLAFDHYSENKKKIHNIFST